MTAATKTWADYLKTRETQGLAAAWKFAQKHFAKSSMDYQSAKRFHAPTSQDRARSRSNQAAISMVSRKEIFENCQFAGLRRIGK